MAHQLDRVRDGAGVALDARLVGLVPDVLGAGVGAGGELHVLGDVDHDRAGAAGAGDVERLVQHAGEIVDVLHQPVVLGAGPGDADRVALLEGVVADQVRRHLAGDAHDGNGIHQRIGEAGDGVGGAGAGGDQHDADLAGRARIAFGGMHRAAFLAHQHVLDLLLLEQLVVDRQHGAAGIAEECSTPWSASARMTISAPVIFSAIARCSTAGRRAGPQAGATRYRADSMGGQRLRINK